MADANTDDGSTQSDEQRPAFVSKLKEGPQRFLAYAIEHSLAIGRRSAEDFVRHFPPTAIMKGLEHNATLRSNILVMTTGIKPKIAQKKPWEAAAADLQIALEEGETDAESVVLLFDPDDRVRYLSPTKLWAFLTEGEFWKHRAKANDADVARTHVAFMLERGLEDKLLTHKDIVEGISVDELATRLPKAELGRLIKCALENAGKSTPFTEADLLATAPPSLLASHVPLPHIWEKVIVPKIAERHGYVEAPSEPVEAAEPERKEPAVAEAPSEAAQVAEPERKERVVAEAKSEVRAAAKASDEAAPSRPSVAKAAPAGDGGLDFVDEIEVFEEEIKAVLPASK